MSPQSLQACPAETKWRPLAHVAVRDEALRKLIVEALRRQDWAVVDSPSGYHLLQSLSGPLLGKGPWNKPELVVVDAFSPGCSGLTIAHGLRDLGWTVPAVLVVNSAEHRARVAEDPDHRIFVAERAVAVPVVLEVAKHFRDGRGEWDSVRGAGEAADVDPRTWAG